MEVVYIANTGTDPPLIYGNFSTGTVGIGTTTTVANIKLALKDRHFQSQQAIAPTAAGA